VSVLRSKESKYIRGFPKLDIEWDAIDRQLGKWSHFLVAGKDLKIEITFNYVKKDDINQPAAGPGKRGPPSATDLHHAKRAKQIDAEGNGL
jgi:hypothetical protein